MSGPQPAGQLKASARLEKGRSTSGQSHLHALYLSKIDSRSVLHLVFTSIITCPRLEKLKIRKPRHQSYIGLLHMTDFPMDVLLFSGSNMQKSVPATPELDLKRLGFRGEIISAFIQERRVLGTSSHHTLNLDKALGKQTCVSGRGGEAFIDTGDKAYQGSNPLIHGIISNAGCGQPCLLDEK